LPLSADLAGRAVAISPDVPASFDVPLAPHHKLLGRWVAAQQTMEESYTRPEARRLIERTFDRAVLEILSPIQMGTLRVVVLRGDEQLPPAIALICDDVGQVDLGWIEVDNVLSNTLRGPVAPMRWQAAAYKALDETLSIALPLFGYEQLFEEFSMYHWDGNTDDVTATRAMIEYLGHEPEDIDEEMLPSAVNARRPAWMIPENAAPLKELPAGLRNRLRRLRAAYKALKDSGHEQNAWYFDFHTVCEYMPAYEDCSTLPPMTLVPADHFARELDDVGRPGMELGFLDIAGLCPLGDAADIDRWFASLKLGADFLLAAQDLVLTDPTAE
jgi:hypothetical protein